MGTYAPNSVFYGKINGINPTELLQKIDYTKNNLEDRKQVVEDLLLSDFYNEYFENYFKVHVTSGDALSEFDNACSSLEKMANYLLNSEEIKSDKSKVEYKFYTDENAFRNALREEVNLESMGNGINQENIIHFLKKEHRNFKKDKRQNISTKDLNRTDLLGEVLRDYKEYLNSVTSELNNYKESNLSRYKLSEISGSIKQDMITSKDQILGVFGYKTNAEESCVIDWYKVDLKNPEHVRALLYMKPGHRNDQNLQYLIEEFVDKLYKAKPTKLQIEIVKLMRENKGPTEIGTELNISKQRVNKNIQMLVNRIIKTN